MTSNYDDPRTKQREELEKLEKELRDSFAFTDQFIRWIELKIELVLLGREIEIRR